LSLGLNDLPCSHVPHPLCQCGVPAIKGAVPSELGHSYFCGNIIDEDDVWLSKYLQSFYWSFCLSLKTRDLSLLAACKKVRMGDVGVPRGISR
jgi:hypothetical protein